MQNALAEKVILPIKNSPNERPRRDRCAGLLPGEPGTRKTTLVREIATIIRWPMIAVPASTIFERGFDMMEARANKVFYLLNQLRHCIIFFDEFEEFFLSRGGRATRSARTDGKPMRSDLYSAEEGYRSRTIAAFTTSAMLPRLQDLHDKEWSLIFLATNHMNKLDEAIVREGRFDFRIEVNRPTVARVREYLSQTLSAKAKSTTGLDALNDVQSKLAIGVVVKALEYISSSARLRFSDVEKQLRKVARNLGESEDSLIADSKEALRPLDGREGQMPRELEELPDDSL